jgi:hypothetical protein
LCCVALRRFADDDVVGVMVVFGMVVVFRMVVFGMVVVFRMVVFGVVEGEGGGEGVAGSMIKQYKEWQDCYSDTSEPMVGYGANNNGRCPVRDLNQRPFDRSSRRTNQLRYPGPLKKKKEERKEWLLYAHTHQSLLRAGGHIILTPANQWHKIWSLSNPGFEPGTYRSLAQRANQLR